MRPGALQAEELLVSGEGASLLPPGVCKQSVQACEGSVTGQLLSAQSLRHTFLPSGTVIWLGNAEPSRR